MPEWYDSVIYFGDSELNQNMINTIREMENLVRIEHERSFIGWLDSFVAEADLECPEYVQILEDLKYYPEPLPILEIVMEDDYGQIQAIIVVEQIDVEQLFIEMLYGPDATF